MSRPVRIRFWPVALLALACFVAVLPIATAQQPSQAWLQGTHAFRYLLHTRGFQPLADWTFMESHPSKTIVIVFGDTDILEKNPRMFAMFVDLGVALFVATDHEIPRVIAIHHENRGVSTRKLSWAGAFGAEFHGQPVLAPPEFSYLENEQCPIIDRSANASPNLWANLKLPVSANRSGYLSFGRSPSGRWLSELAALPQGTWHNGIIQPKRTFAVGGEWGRGRVLLMADHSVFINNMLLQEDLGNVGFTYNCLDWLRDGPDGPRDHVLFYDDGNIETKFDVPVTLPPIRLPDDPINIANQLLAGLENENKHNELLMHYIGFERILAFLAILLTSLLGVYLIRRLWRSRYRLDAGMPLLAATLSRYPPTGAGLSQRHKALLADGNLWEPARAMARDFFETALATHEPPEKLPAFQASENWLTRRFLDKLLQHLWRLAYGKSPERIAPASFAHMAAQLDELKAALSDGSLRFQTPASS